jgi:hypothetical protein
MVPGAGLYLFKQIALNHKLNYQNTSIVAGIVAGMVSSRPIGMI